ncbi:MULTISPECIES: ABC transporter ATP-binding protein [Nitrobacteraceae]|uniref:Branched-chain amino acid transport system ATP-binding protein n=1 Tax=Bradyrhizobium canariense TaxID=255045 RepID=A0A1H1SK35_9BRAD|nr:ABC transporter ATP-binding protein [Bradyrhizobium canariense]SDS47719.1 branched-chain amino acid transport system ATP-binding protein [Bradyrhizobium canariense]
MLELKKIESGYGPARILHGVSLTVGKAEIVCLLGSNGAGKTTTLLTILGILKPSAGTMVFNGEALGGCKTTEIVRRGIAIVPEGRRIFGPMTVAENLMIGASVRNEPAAAAETLEMVLELFPLLRERLDQLSGTLSGGQQQMLAIGRALMTRPQLILMDEPSMGLSPLMCDEVFDIILRIRDRGLSVLLVEQNAYASLAVASRGYVLESGQIALEGSARELREDDMIKEAYL